MSRSLALPIAVLLLSLSLAACGGGGEEAAPTGQTPGAGPAGGTVSIDLWHAENAANLDTLERLASQFNSSQNEVKVRPIYQGKDEELLAKLRASLGSSQVPAIAFVPDVNAQMMIDSGAVRPVQDFIDREGYDLSDLDPKSAQEYTVQGKLWAMPFGAGMPLLYYNKVTFREVGLDPEKPPQDLEEVRQYSEKILKRDAGGNVVRSGIAIDVQDWIEHVLAEHAELDNTRRKIMQLQIEREALKKEKDPASKERLKQTEKQLAELGKKDKLLTEQWEGERKTIDYIKELKRKIDEAHTQFEDAQCKGDLERAARLKYETIANLKKELEEKEGQLAKQPAKGGSMIQNEVTEEQVASVVSKWTGIPVSRLMSGERDRLMKMEELIHQRVVGQDEAVSALCNAVRRNRAGLGDPNRPIGIFHVPGR